MPTFGNHTFEFNCCFKTCNAVPTKIKPNRQYIKKYVKMINQRLLRIKQKMPFFFGITFSSEVSLAPSKNNYCNCLTLCFFNTLPF